MASETQEEVDDLTAAFDSLDVFSHSHRSRAVVMSRRQHLSFAF